MNILEMNKEILRGKKTPVKYNPIDNGDLVVFNQILNIDESIKLAFDGTEDASRFYRMIPDAKVALGNTDAESVFYAFKLGYAYTGAPAKLVYVLTKSLNGLGGKYINTAIFGVYQYLRPYVNTQWVSDAGEVTLKDLIENVYNKPIDLLTESKPLIKSDDAYELYISDVDRIAILPVDIGELISYEDALNVKFDSSVGIVLSGIPLRSFNGRLGITMDDFDLRECV